MGNWQCCKDDGTWLLLSVSKIDQLVKSILSDLRNCNSWFSENDKVSQVI